MEEKYNPNFLLGHTASHFFEPKKEHGIFTFSNEEIAKYKIEIEIEDSPKHYTIQMDKKGNVLLHEGAEISGRIKNHEVLEQNKEKLKAVKIFKQNLEIIKFNSFDDFIKIIGA